jgi:DNA-3-methyladenine glycosylase II
VAEGNIVVVTQTTSIPITGPYDLGEIAMMGFGHRDERNFDGVMRWPSAWTEAMSGSWGVACSTADSSPGARGGRRG